jgi:AcrR family transcriptional regulator
MSTLRERQNQLARDLIMSAVAEIVAERGFNFSIQDVADRAGMSHRSVYRHFPSREALLGALYEWTDAKIGGRDLFQEVPAIEDLPELTRRVFRLFEQQPALLRALVIASLTMGFRSDLRDRRRQAMLEAYTPLLPDMDAAERAGVFALFEHLSGSVTWLSLTERSGLSSEEAGNVVSWAMTVLIENLESRRITPGVNGDGRKL